MLLQMSSHYYYYFESLTNRLKTFQPLMVNTVTFRKSFLPCCLNS